MRYKVYYNKGLRMSPEKLAAQVAHVTLNLGFHLGNHIADFLDPLEQTIIVLGLSATKFKRVLEELEEEALHREIVYHVQKDLGYTEIEAGTKTAFGFI